MENYNTISEKMYKQVIVLRKDVKMSKGKAAAQVGHASVGAYRNAKKTIIEKWYKEGGKKIVLIVESKNELMTLYEKAKEEKLSTFLVKDSGLTELKPGTITALGIGPDHEKKIDKITGKLKLLK